MSKFTDNYNSDGAENSTWLRFEIIRPSSPDLNNRILNVYITLSTEHKVRYMRQATGSGLHESFRNRKHFMRNK
jgi:hypothetical protein